MKKLLVIIALSQWCTFSCRTPPPEKQIIKDEHTAQSETPLSGKELSRKHCQSCHLYPEPSLLDKQTWERSVLPLMGRLFGIYEREVPRSEILKGAIDQPLVKRLNIFPEKQIIDDKTWKMIRDYYVTASPESLPSIKSPDNFPPLERFEIAIAHKAQSAPGTTLLKIDPLTSAIYVGESKGKAGELTILNSEFEVTQTIKLPAPPVDVNLNSDHLDVTLVGSLVLAPSNNSLGRLLRILRNPGEEKYSSFRSFMDGLKRPLQTVFEDINGDGHDDILIAEFGYYTGSLTLYESVGGKGSFRKKVLKNVPGAIKLSVTDMNRDGRKDIVALFAQGDESISIFYNNEHGMFREERVLRFSPSNGSVYFELADFNNDGHPDILYCNGDNGDYPPVLKDYHGIHIFQNQGNNNFERVYFFAMNGAYKSSAADFDNDGDLDIIGISHFPDFNASPRQDFVYLENLGDYSFSTQYLVGDLPVRWITFDIHDIDHDGFKDVLLGAFGTYKTRQNKTKPAASVARPSLLYLKNIGR
jgi:hypothetical protein